MTVKYWYTIQIGVLNNDLRFVVLCSKIKLETGHYFIDPLPLNLVHSIILHVHILLHVTSISCTTCIRHIYINNSCYWDILSWGCDGSFRGQRLNIQGHVVGCHSVHFWFSTTKFVFETPGHRAKRNKIWAYKYRVLFATKCARSVQDRWVHFRFLTTTCLKNILSWSKLERNLGLR